MVKYKLKGMRTNKKELKQWSTKSLCFSFVFCLLSFVSFGQVSASIDTTQIRIGEEIQYTIIVTADTTDQVVFPEGQTFLPLEVIESYKVDTTYEQARVKLLKKYGLTEFDSGSYLIPPQKVYINEKPYQLDSLRVEVRDVPVDTTQQKMFDIKQAQDVESPPFNFFKLLYWIVPILLLVGLVLFILFRRKKIAEAKEVRLPPYEEALTALKELDNSTYLKENKSKEYYSQLTEIVKRYLDREVDDTALESTTDELIERLRLHKDAGSFDFDAENLRELEQILKRADLVKFAKMQQDAGQANADRGTIEEIINETHEAVPEPTEEELLENELYLEELKKKKQRKKRITFAVGVFVAILLFGVGYGFITGFDNLKDTILGNQMRDYAEGRWIKSEYGSPAIIIETPEVLVRQELVNDSLTSLMVKDQNVFSFGDIEQPLYVSISTVNYSEPQDQTLELALDQALIEFEKNGATNLLVKRDDFETEKGIKGIKASGTFNVKVAENKILKEESNYQLLLFAQETGLQQVVITYQYDERFAEEVVDRIIASVELEIQENQGEK